MKKYIVLIITLFILLFCSCNTIDPEGIVTKVETLSTNQKEFKYKVTIEKMGYVGAVTLYTNSLYSVGDTLYISKKINWNIMIEKENYVEKFKLRQKVKYIGNLDLAGFMHKKKIYLLLMK